MKNSARGELVEPCELCVSVVKSLFFFGCGSAALRLCGEYSFTVNPEQQKLPA